MTGTLNQAVQADLIRLLTSASDWMTRTNAPPPVPAPGSSLAGDDRATGPYHISHAVFGKLVSAVDHYDALRTLITEAHALHARAPFSLLRGALENAATAVWLLAPCRRDERILRRLRLQWADMRDGEKARELAGEKASRPLKVRQGELRALASARGLSRDQIARVASTPVAYGTIAEQAGDGIGLNGETVRLVWMIASGLAHARYWAILSTLEREEVRPATEDILHLRLTAPESTILGMTQVAALMIQSGWALLDRRSTAFEVGT